MAAKIPRDLKGPFVVSYYDYRNATIYLKKETGEWTSTKTYPAFFIDLANERKFPFKKYGKYILAKQTEGKYLRIVRDPEMDRDVLQEMYYECLDEEIPLYEADASPVRRWFSDTGALVSQKYRNLYFDLETDPLVIGFDDEAKKTHRVICFAARDDDGNSFFDYAKESTDEEEEKLLKRFLKLCSGYDNLLAWNGDNYDFFVLQHRCKKHKIKVDWRDWNKLDHMRVVKKILMSVSDADFKRSFALDVIGETLLGLRKIKLPVGPGQMKLLLTDGRLNLLEEYNKRDVEIMTAVEEKKEFLKLHYAICSMCRTFPNRGSIYPNELADGMMLRFAIKENRHFPTREVWNHRDDSDEVKYEGAYVVNPIVGYHTNIQVPDFASLYPSIIRSFNMSPDTILEKGKKYDDFNGEYCTTPATNVSFRTDIEGIIPKALSLLIAKRNEYKAKAKKFEIGSDEYNNTINLSTAVKVVANSMYGLIGNEGSRYHNKDIAPSITLTAQLLNRKVISYFDSIGMKVVYGDSVAGSRICVIKDHGITKLMPFDELWKLGRNPRPYKKTKEIADLVNVYTLSRKGNEVGWYPATYIIRHHTDKRIFKIRTARGETEVTEDHSISCGGEFVSVHELINRELKFDTIRPPLPDPDPSIDMYDYLEEEIHTIHRREYPWTLVGRFERVKYKHKGYCLKLDNSYFQHKESIPRYMTSETEVDQKTLRGLLTIVALYLSGGKIVRKGIDWYIDFTHKFKSVMNEAKFAIRDYLPNADEGEIYAKQSGTKKTYHYLVQHKTLAALLISVCKEKGNKEVPSFIYDLPKEEIKFFLIKLGDFRGQVDRQHWRLFEIATKNLKLSSGIHFAMSMIGWNTGLRYEKVWTKTTNPSFWWMIDVRTRFINFADYDCRKIVEVRKPNPEEYVYDIHVPEAQTFIDTYGNVLLHNTDSVFVHCDEDRMKQEIEKINTTVIPKFLDSVGCKTKEVKLEYDKGYKALLLVSKKRYVGKLSVHKGREAKDDVPLEVKGLEIQRGEAIKYLVRLMNQFIELLITPDVNPIDMDQRMIDECDKFFTQDIALEDIEISQGIKRHPSQYATKLPHVHVAEQMIAEGMEFFPGMKIPYVVINGKPNVTAIHSSKFNGIVDRKYYWEKKILPAIMRLMEARFPGYPFSNFNSPGQIVFDFTQDVTKYKETKMPVRKLSKPTERIKRIPNAYVSVDGARNEIMKILADLVRLYPGNMPLNIVVITDDAEVTIRTQEKIDMNGLKEIHKLFPQLQISPKPI